MPGADAPAADAVLVELAGRLSHELHPGRRRARQFTLKSAIEHDLGLDSLGRIELFSRIERAFGTSLPESVLVEAENLQDLMAALRSAPRAADVLPLSPIEHGVAEAAGALPEHATTLVDALRWHVQVDPDRVHVHFDRGGALRPLSYGALLEQAERAACGLSALGVRARDAVSVMLPTDFSYFFTFFGALLLGAVPVPLYPPARSSQIADHLRRQAGILANARAALLVTTPEVQRLGLFMTSRVDSLRRVVTPAELGAAASGGAPASAARAPQASDLALLQYTSGSTGRPKGVALTHANLLANVRAMGDAAQVTSADVVVSWLPLYHDMGLIGAWLGSLYHGCPFVLMSPQRFLTRPARWLWAIHSSRGTLSPAPNFAYELCASRVSDEEVRGLDLSSWRMALNGAEPVSPTTLRRFCERFAGCGFRPEAMAPVYGLAECSVGLAFPPLGRGPRIDCVQRAPFVRAGRALPAEPDDSRMLEFVECGQPLPCHEIRIVDAAGRELPDRVQGRVQFRGPSATAGYFRNPAENARLFDGNWLESGDLGYVVDGALYVTGRSKDIILRGGRNIYPHELEDAIGRLDGVRKGCVAVFGSADPAHGTERVVIVAETRTRDRSARDRLREEIAAVASALLEAPADDVVLAPPRSVPKTTSGKIRRAACREAYERGALRGGGAPLWLQLAGLAADAAWLRLRRGLRAAADLTYAAYALGLSCALVPVAWLLVVTMPSFAQSFAALRRVARAWLALSATPLRVHGADLDSLRRARVLVANHASYLDGLVLAAALPTPVRFVVKAELSHRLWTRLPLDRLRVLYVERTEAAQSVADARGARAAIHDGDPPLLFFPEGTLTRAPGILPFHLGAFTAAAETSSALVPVLLRGTRSKLRGGSWFLRRGAVEVRFGPLHEPSGRTFSAALQLRDATRRFVLEKSGEPDLSV